MRTRLASLLLLATLPLLSACETAQQVLASSGSALSPTTFSEGEVLHVLLTLNQGEVLTNEAAASRATDANARAFAQDMARAHTDVIARLEALAQSEHLTASANKLSTHLDNTARAQTDYLRTLSGRPLDLYSVRLQIVMHQNALDFIDVTATPAVQNANLKGFLQTMRPTIAQHLDRARTLERALQ